MWDEQGRYQHAFDHDLEAKLITIDRQSESRANHESNAGAPRRHYQPVAETGSEVLISDGIDEPAQGQGLRWKRRKRLVVERRHGDHKRRQHEKGEYY